MRSDILCCKNKAKLIFFKVIKDVDFIYKLLEIFSDMCVMSSFSH